MADKILYIDDEVDFLNSIVSILSRKGYEVIPAKSGEEGLAAFAKQEIPLVVSDYKMPGLSGTDVLQRIKAQNPDTCVILASAYPSTKNTLEALKFGAFDFLIKPFKLEDLLQSIERGLRSRLTQIQNRKIIERYQQTGDMDLSQKWDSVPQQFAAAYDAVQALAGRHATLDTMLLSAGSLLQGGKAAWQHFELAMSVVMHCKRKDGTDDGDLVTAALLAAAGQEALALFPRFYEIIFTAKQKLGSADGHGVAAAILASAGQHALELFSDETYERVPSAEGSYDGLAVSAAIMAVLGKEKSAAYGMAKQKINAAKQKTGTEDGDNVTAAVLLMADAMSLEHLDTVYHQIGEVKARRGSFDATGLAAAILTLAPKAPIENFERIYKEMAARGRGSHDALSITAALLSIADQLQPGQRSFGEAWFVIRG